MKRKQIIFTGINKAELLENELGELNAQDVLVKLEVTTISCGTERANVSGNRNIGPVGPANLPPVFPRYGGYSGAGVVLAVGSEVTEFKPGDRVATSWGVHATHIIVPESNVSLLPDEISFEEGAILHIGTFPMAAIRKTRLEIGEAAIVMGQGILGLIAVQMLHIAGACPVIAADPVKERREMALKFGADYALNPMEEGFAQKVKELTGGKGTPVAIEVTGKGLALDQVLDCMAPFGRVALLGCTRESDFTIDYYRKVHGPGVSLIGAHTNARPGKESSEFMWTTKDDKWAEIKLLVGGRLHYLDMIAETYRPEECTEVYERLVNDRNFPICVQFDWRECK